MIARLPLVLNRYASEHTGNPNLSAPTNSAQEVLPKFRYAEEETLRRTKLAKAMREERAASGNAYGFTLVESNTGENFRSSPTL